ncbi:MAG: SpoIID/LytB domain-containing protein [Faecalibacterium sp.]|jgi:stage II sporulation protein D|nr:SpoIID/LytB domain-containing protein [Faecalibacterium sp.]
MKKATLLLALILLLSCLAPVGSYYLMLAVEGKGAAGTLQQLRLDAAGSGSAAALRTAPEAAKPNASAAPKTSPQPSANTVLTVLVQDTSSGEVLSVPLREYVIGAVASEMPMTWEDAALQAQAVSIHTYVLYCRDHNDTASMGGAWLTADPARRQGFMTDAVLHSYWGTDYDANYARLSKLVDQVLGTVVTYEGQPAATSYFAISNGRTEASQNVWNIALPYLQGVDSSADKQAEGCTCTVTYTSQQMYDALVSALGLAPGSTKPGNYFTNYIKTDAGYIYSVDVCGTTVRGTVLRSALHLRSTCFSISYADNLFTITTVGYGHGVGLSQCGAEAMSKSGSTWQDILAHYFPGTTLAAA